MSEVQLELVRIRLLGNYGVRSLGGVECDMARSGSIFINGRKGSIMRTGTGRRGVGRLGVFNPFCLHIPRNYTGGLCRALFVALSKR